MKSVLVEYKYGTYAGSVRVQADEDDDNEVIIARAKRLLRPHMTLPMAYESYRIVGDE